MSVGQTIAKASAVLVSSLAAAGLFANSAVAGTAAAAADNAKDKTAVLEPKPREPRFHFSLGIGTDVDYRATAFSEEARGTVVLPAASGLSGGTDRAGRLRLERRRYDSVFPYDLGNGPYRVQGEFGYAASRHGEVFGTVRYTHAGSDTTRLGTASFADVIPANGVGVLRGFNVPVFADFDDYDSVGFELGVRLFLLPKEARLRPYLSIAGGATYVSDINARFFLPDGTTLFDGEFYRGGVVATASVLTGVEFALTRSFSIGAEGGARYEFPLDQRDGDLRGSRPAGAAGAAGISNAQGANNAGDRFYLPFTIYSKVRF